MGELLLAPEAVMQEGHAADLCQRARCFAKKLMGFLFFLLIPRCKPLTSGLEQVNPPPPVAGNSLCQPVPGWFSTKGHL